MSATAISTAVMTAAAMPAQHLFPESHVNLPFPAIETGLLQHA
jgi:hypothetical protein